MAHELGRRARRHATSTAKPLAERFGVRLTSAEEFLRAKAAAAAGSLMRRALGYNPLL